jgi:SAM-dependent methyltransferase
MYGWLSGRSPLPPPAARPPDEFRGSPWGVEPTTEWNCPAYWDGYYRELLAGPDSPRRGRVVHREVGLLIRMLGQAHELPRSAPMTLLDGGCGVALIAHVLAYWGFRVTAVDSCPRAVEVASGYRPTEADLAGCVPIWDPCPDMPGAFELVDDAARSLGRLRDFRAPGGSVEYLAGDWFEADLRPGSFGAVHCRNSLRRSTRPYWRRSLVRFHELLSPGGVLLLEHVNAVGIQAEVEDLLAECGFTPLAAGTAREPTARYVSAAWPTG